MWSWIAIAVLALLAPRLLRWWVRHQTRAHILGTPLVHGSYSEVARESIPPAIREGLGAASRELGPLGFELVGYIQTPEFGVTIPRFQAVHRHPGEYAFAIVGFAVADRKGAIVDFMTLFADGWWLRTVNRRAHFCMPLESGRVGDALVATMGEQWQFHQRAVALETARSVCAADLGDLVRRKNALEDEELELGVRNGDCRPVDGGSDFRFTSEGAARLTARLQAAAPRLASVPPVSGAFAIRNPAEELERKFQNLLYVVSRRPKSRGRWAFLLSALAFGASALVFKHWAWLLWAIPFLLFHELGHWAAMRMFGHRDATIRFIPFLGAATMTTKQFSKLSHEMVVLLAGPVPGLLLGFLLFQLADFGRHPYVLSSAITLVTINGLNLLPLHPLDGGRILHALVTAGRPRLDVALKAAAGALFVVGAIAFKDPTLIILAALGLLLLRPGLRQARLDNHIRRQPGFGPTLTPEERRRFIFDALSEQGGGDGIAWVRSVQQLEVSLGHGQQRGWQALPWTVAYAASLAGLVAWSVGVFAVVPAVAGGCPPRARARPVACAEAPSGDEIDWTRRDPGSITRNPFKVLSTTAYPFAAFVWCTAERTASYEGVRHLMEISAADGFCPALPWETLPEETQSQRDKARFTLSLLNMGGWRATRTQRLARLDDMPAVIRKQKNFDEETFRLYRSSLQSGAEGEDHRLLSERLGRSPSDSCKQLQILNIGEDRDARRENETEDDGDDSGDEGVSKRVGTTRLSVMMASPVAFAPLRRYLCDAGCQVDVLPYGSMDPRLHRCF